jgi:hypothetical protein
VTPSSCARKVAGERGARRVLERHLGLEQVEGRVLVQLPAVPLDGLAHRPRVAREDEGGEVDVPRVELEQRAASTLGRRGARLAVVTVLPRELARGDVPTGGERGGSGYTSAGQQPPARDALLHLGAVMVLVGNDCIMHVF